MVGIFLSTLTLVPICIKCLLDDGFDIVVDVDKLFIYDIYLVIYPMSCLPVSKTYGMLGGLLMSELVIVGVMLILVYDNLCSVYASFVC